MKLRLFDAVNIEFWHGIFRGIISEYLILSLDFEQWQSCKMENSHGILSRHSKKQLDDWNRKESYSWKYFAQKMEFSIKHFFS